MSTSSEVPASTPPMFAFEARSEDPAMELFLIDARMRLVARGRRELSTTQPPGIYTLKLRAGPSAREELIVLDRPMTYVVKPLEFASAVPLDGTGQSHEYHQKAAFQQSSKVNLQLGKGSSLFVFAREWTPSSREPASGHHPAEGLALYSGDGAQLVDFQTQSDVELKLDPWAACRMDLTPGMYRLGVRTATGECFEMSVPLIPGYFHKVFLLQRGETGRLGGRRPDLARASFLMSRREAFARDTRDNRIAEIARLALVDRRQVYGDEWTQLVSRKFDHPMMGILGGHLLLLEKEPNLDLLKEIVLNLRDVLPTEHPDVEALALAAGIGTRYQFAAPPMLRQSWRIVLEHSKRNPRLVPSGSLSASIATQVTPQEPWLIWRRPGSEKQLAKQERGFSDAIRSKLTATMVAAVTKLVTGKAKTGVPALDEMVSSLNIPPATVARLVETAWENMRQKPPAPAPVAKRTAKAAVKKAAAKKPAPKRKA